MKRMKKTPCSEHNLFLDPCSFFPSSFFIFMFSSMVEHTKSLKKLLKFVKMKKSQIYSSFFLEFFSSQSRYLKKIWVSEWEVRRWRNNPEKMKPFSLLYTFLLICVFWNSNWKKRTSTVSSTNKRRIFANEA